MIAKAFSQRGNLIEAEKYTEQSLLIGPNYGAYILKSIIEFLHKSNPEEALKYVYLARDLAKSDGTWRYNEGFLLMYMEKFDEALKVYRKIVNTS